MRANEVMGIIFANAHDRYLSDLTQNRAIASVLFGGRYRLIDFPLSSLVNAGIGKVGVITENNYRSLMDHIGSGKPWDLDRKSGGLFILPPYNTAEAGDFNGHIEGLWGAMTFLRRSKEKYVVLCDADVVCNIDIEALVDRHIETGADITLCYKHGTMPENDRDVMAFTMTSDHKIDDICFKSGNTPNVDFSLDIFVMERELLIALILEASSRNLRNLSRDIIMPKVKTLSLYGYEITGYAEVMDGMDSYVRANMKLLDPEVRRELFAADRPIYTKSRDNMPTRYGVNAKTYNSLIGDGSVILGTVRNSIIFRDVTVEEGAVLENCIIMQGAKIGKNAKLKHIVADKNAVISDSTEMAGAATYPSFVKKGSRI